MPLMTMSKWLSQHLNIKHLHLHLLITGENIYPVNLLPVFIFTYCFSALTQVKLDPFLLTFPMHLYVSTYKFYLLAFSTQHSFFYPCNSLAMTKPKNSVKLKRTSSTSVLIMGVELQVSGRFASGAMESSIYYYFLNTASFLRKKKPEVTQIPELPKARENRVPLRERGQAERRRSHRKLRVRFVSV